MCGISTHIKIRMGGNDTHGQRGCVIDTFDTFYPARAYNFRRSLFLVLGKVMRLLKCLYGLKQSPRQWNIYIDTILKQLGFKWLKSDFGIYVKGEGEDCLVRYRLGA